MPTFTSGNDTYTVNAPGTYTLDMLAGDDRLNVYGGTTVTAHLGDGNDLAILKAAAVTIFGDAGADRFDIYVSNALVDGGADNDTINFRGGGSQTAHGGIGDDRFNFYADATNVSLFGDDGNDDFYGYLHSISGTIAGGAGNDYFVQFTTGVTLAGGLGNDIYRVTATGAATISEALGEGTDSVQIARGFSYTLADNVENISVQGFSGSVLTAATINGNALNNRIAAHNNDESINGLDGNDNIGGKGGNDTLSGGNGNDYLDGGTGDDILTGGAGTDILQGRTGSDTMAGGTGNDTYYVDSLGDLVAENIGDGTDLVRASVSGYTLTSNVENGYLVGIGDGDLAGNELNNLIVGSSGKNLLDGYGGNDTINGGAGDDSLWGWDGDDTLNGGAGNDEMVGSTGNDVLNGGTGDDSMDGGDGNDTYYVDSASDTISEFFGGGTDFVHVSVASYTLGANVDNATLHVTGSLTGNALANSITGTSGSDTLDGDDGADTLFGGGGADILIGGGTDPSFGDDDQDIFVYSSTSDSSAATGIDQISEFEHTSFDKIDLHLIDADTGTAGDQAFNWATTTPTAHSVWYSPDIAAGTHNFYIYADVNGDTTADLTIHILVESGTPGTDFFYL